MPEKKLPSKTESKPKVQEKSESTLQCVPCGNTWKQSAGKICDVCGKAGTPVTS